MPAFRPPCDSTLDFPPGSPVTSAATYPGRGPGAVAGSWRRCRGWPRPSTPLRGRAAPRRVSRLLPRPLPGPRAPDGVPGNESWSQQEMKLLPRLAPRLPGGGQTPGAGGRQAPRICPGGGTLLFIRALSAHTPPNEAQHLIVVASTLIPPKLPHTHTHTPGHFRAALGPAHPLPLLGRT